MSTRVRYARITPGRTAGTVAVTFLHSQPMRARLRVDYDLTALTNNGARWLQEFADDFAGYIAQWEAAIAGHPTGHHDLSE